MIEGIITAILLLLHILTCAALYYGYKYQRLNLKKVYMPFVILIPFWGVLCVLLLNVKAITDSGKKKEIGIEKMRVNEEIYKNIFSGITQERKEVVPLEEALIINSPSQRRKLIMDVLYDNPEEYIDLLYEARMNDDVEVVHYATTAMSELSKEYDLKIQKMEHDYAKNSNDEAILSDYCELLEKYISSGLMQGQPLILQRNQYEQLLEKKEILEV